MPSRRAGGAWGIAFVVLLLGSAAMVSLPTGAETGEKIASFYKTNGSVIVAQQILGMIALAPFVAFALSLSSYRWLKPVVALLVVFQEMTNAILLVLVGATLASNTTSITVAVVFS